MRRQVIRQSKRVMSHLGPEIPSQLRMFPLSSIHSNSFKSLPPRQHNPLLLKEPKRLWSTHSDRGPQNVFLSGNIVRSPHPDIDIPEMSIHEYLFSKLDEFKTYPAMTEFLTGKSYTYEDVKINIIKVASALTRLGYKKGDTFIAFSTNQNDFTLLTIVASCLGITFSAANPTFNADELAIQLINCEPKAIFALAELAPIVKDAVKKKEVLHKTKHLFAFGEADGFYPFHKLLEDDGKAFPDVSINPKEDVFALPYSSGTTGLPKGVMLTHYSVVANLLQMKTMLYFSPEDNVLGLLPLYHLFGMVVIQISVLLGGGHIHYLPKFEPESFLRCMQDSKISTAHLVPPIMLFLAKHPIVSNFDLSNLKRVICAAAPLGKELTMEFKTRFPQEISVNQGFGMTELSPASNLDAGENIPSVGSLLCNTYGKIVHLDTGEVLGPNQEGEYCIKGPQIMKGYLNNIKATDEMIDSEGWLHTGDIAYYDETGLFYVSDRLKELIKYKGSQVAPAELEALLLGHPAVQDVAVIGIPDVAAGELPRAFIVTKPDSNVVEEDIIKYVEEKVSPVKRLRGGVKFVNEIPKSPSGKILRRLLRTV